MTLPPLVPHVDDHGREFLPFIALKDIPRLVLLGNTRATLVPSSADLPTVLLTFQLRCVSIFMHSNEVNVYCMRLIERYERHWPRKRAVKYRSVELLSPRPRLDGVSPRTFYSHCNGFSLRIYEGRAFIHCACNRALNGICLAIELTLASF